MVVLNSIRGTEEDTEPYMSCPTVGCPTLVTYVYASETTVACSNCEQVYFEENGIWEAGGTIEEYNIEF